MRKSCCRFGSRGAVLAAMLIVLSTALTACGSSGGSNGSFTKAASAPAVSFDIPKSGCGAVATPEPRDPDGVLAALPAEYQQQYAGYANAVHKTPWANFKPDHGPPYKVTLSFAQITGPTQLAMYEGMKKAFANNPDIKFDAVTSGSQLNIPLQLQQFQSQLDSKPDLMIVEPLTDAFGPLADKAAKKGVPVISMQGTTSSKSAINIQGNSYGTSAIANSFVFRKMGGKGTVMYVHGIASSTNDQDSFKAFKAALKNCPDIKFAGEIGGAFVNATAKSETLKFLATHPESDRRRPPDGRHGTRNHAGLPAGRAPDAAGCRSQRLQGVARVSGSTTRTITRALARASRPSLSVRPSPISPPGCSRAAVPRSPMSHELYPPIDQDNLDQWAKTEWNLDTPGVSEGPPNTYFPTAYIDGLFSKPAK